VARGRQPCIGAKKLLQALESAPPFTAVLPTFVNLKASLIDRALTGIAATYHYE
jgi:hypothetical protein